MSDIAAYNIEETFLQDFLEILNRSDFRENPENMFPSNIVQYLQMTVWTL